MMTGSSAAGLGPLEHRVKQGRVHYLVILGLALLLRCLIVIPAMKGDPRWFFKQASEYGCLAQSLLAGHGYASPFCGSTGPSAFLAPGYPLIVATAFRIFGVYSPHAAMALISLQVLFGVLTVLMVMLLAKRLMSSSAANIAGLLCAISPPAVCLPILFWETSLSTLLLTTVVLLALNCVGREEMLRWAGFGAYCAAAMFVNPSLVLTFATVFIWTAWRNRVAGLKAPALALLVWCTIFSIWPIRNAYRLHAFVPLRTNLGYELWQGNQPGSDGTFSVAFHPNTSDKEYARYAELGEIGYMREKSVLAIAAIKADKMRFVQLSVGRFAEFWATPSKAKSSPGLGLSIATTSLISVIGLGLMLRRKDPATWLLLAPFAILPAPYYLTHADFRFRLLLDPLAILLVTYVLREIHAFVRSHRAADQADGRVIARQIPAQT